MMKVLSIFRAVIHFASFENTASFFLHPFFSFLLPPRSQAPSLLRAKRNFGNTKEVAKEEIAKCPKGQVLNFFGLYHNGGSPPEVFPAP